MEQIRNRERLALVVVGLGFAFVSALCEVLLLIEGTEGVDALINGITAICLVACQFVFAYLLPVVFKLKRYLLGVLMLLSIAALFFVSVSGTASYFDARSSTIESNSSTQSNEYIEYSELIASYKTDVDEFNALAKEETKNGNNWQAAQNKKEGIKAKQKWEAAILKRKAIQPTAKTSMGALTSIYEGNESWFSYALAVLIDFSPLLCFSLLGYRPAAKQKVIAVKEIKKTSGATEEESATDIDPLYIKVADEVKQGLYGDKPSQRAVQENHGFNNPRRTKRLFDQLELHGLVIRPDGSRMYLRTKKGGLGNESINV